MAPIQIPGSVFDEVPLSAIDPGERFRQDYGDLTDLIHSIKTHGLINPVTVTPKQEAPNEYWLVAGGRRLASLTHLQVATVPVRVFPKPLTELELRILELTENLQRKEMTWQETNNLQRRIHALQQEIHGKPVKGSAEKKGWSIEDTAAMLGVSESQIKQSLRLTEKFEKFADVLGDPKQYRKESDAIKAIKIVEEAAIRAELVRRAKKKAGVTSMLGAMESRYQLMDAIEGLATMPSESFDFCECDPPYGISLPDVKMGDTCTDYKELDEGNYIVFNAALLREIYRVLKPDTFCIFWFAIDPWLETLYKLAIEADFTLHRTPLIWVKPSGQSLSPSTSLASAYETALVLKKGQPILAKPGRTNVFQFSPMAAANKHHPTQKPIELYQEVFQTFSFENARCVSPFAGSGAALVAAQLCGRTCVGFDLSEEYKKGYLKMVSEIFQES